MSKNMDIVSLAPVSKMIGDYLFEMITKVIMSVTNYGFTIYMVISDNNVINRESVHVIIKNQFIAILLLKPVNNLRIYILVIALSHTVKNFINYDT